MPSLSRRTRLMLALLGLLIILCSLAALAYAFGPLDQASLQATLSPTLLAPP